MDQISYTKLCWNGKVAPTLFVIGCQKCGTTSLWEDAVKHIYGLTTGTYKEHHYWYYKDTRYVDGTMDNYVMDFPDCDDLEDATLPSKGQIIGADFDPQMGYQDVPQNIAAAYTDAFGTQSLDDLTFVSILRDPVNRTFSYFYHALNEGWLDVVGCDDCCDGWWVPSSCDCDDGEPEGASCCTEKLTEAERYATCNTTFDHWVDTQLDRANDCLAKTSFLNHEKTLWPDCGDSGLFASLYVYQLENFVQFFRNSQMKIIPFDLYTADPNRAVTHIAQWAGAWGYQNYTYNAEDVNTATGQQRFEVSMSPDTEAKLVEFFEPYNRMLYEFIRMKGIEVAGDDVDDFLDTPQTDHWVDVDQSENLGTPVP